MFIAHRFLWFLTLMNANENMFKVELEMIKRVGLFWLKNFLSPIVKVQVFLYTTCAK